MRSTDLDRRTFLARLGLLGAVAGGSLVLPNAAGVAAASTTQELLPLLRQILAEMTRDTFNGLAVFIAPGPDPYSVAQGVPYPAPGGIEARTPEFLITMFDELVTLPGDLDRALAGGLAAVPFPNPDDLPDVPPDTVHSVVEAVQIILTGPDLLPLSQIIGLLLNTVATLVSPASATGDFLSPFARLAFGHKAAVASLLEDRAPGRPAGISVHSPPHQADPAGCRGARRPWRHGAVGRPGPPAGTAPAGRRTGRTAGGEAVRVRRPGRERDVSPGPPAGRPRQGTGRDRAASRGPRR